MNHDKRPDIPSHSIIAGGGRDTVVTAESSAVAEKVFDQVARADFQKLCEEYVRAENASNSTSEDPLKDIWKAYIATFPDRAAALATLEQCLQWYQVESVKEQLYQSLQSALALDVSRSTVEMQLDRLEYCAISELENEHLRPFLHLYEEMTACSQLPVSQERRQRRQELFDVLKKMTEEYCITYEHYNGREDQRWILVDDTDEGLRLWRIPSLNVSIAGKHSSISVFYIPKMLNMFRRMKFQEMMNDMLLSVDHERIRQDTLVYGAKTANLHEMMRGLPAMQQILERNSIAIAIPRFEGIPASLYDAWKAGKDIDEALHTHYQWIGGKGIFVRSSAVYSEDNDTATGAGIYHSEEIPPGASFEEFKAAVIRVYASVDSEKAQQYRRDIGIAEEKMGITLQDAVHEYGDTDEDENTLDDFHGHGKGYINTSRAFAPGLIDVVTDDGVRPIFVQERVEQYMANGGMHGEKDMYYYQPDMMMRHFGYRMTLHEHGAFLACLLEKAYGMPVQCEFVANGRAINIVQTRILPQAHRSLAHVEFPSEEPLLVRDATGVLDEELDILPHDKNNNQKKGLVIFLRSYFTSNLCVEQYFPKEGAVMIVAPSNESAGHIETLCIEKGLTCIFRSQTGFIQGEQHPELNYGPSALGFDHNNQLANVVGVNGHTRVRVVANGFEARIYPA